MIIADHPLDREIITKLKNGLYDIELENDEVVNSIIRSRQEWVTNHRVSKLKELVAALSVIC
ncbi:MAG: hypothetical protein Q3M24_06195 [Candidatus Electrothrix aestuarii]|uniref:Uncharacterized protein n=1 Tax=Candidatus Electrothrix aestuarii TaxID=3062594 RepID=A0AAU8M286_9BACT